MIPPRIPQRHPSQIPSQAQSGRQRISWKVLLLAALLTGGLLLVIGPAFYAGHQLRQAMQDPDVTELDHRIPDALLQGLFPDLKPYQQWQGAGRQYLQQVWPTVYRNLNRHVVLQLQYQQQVDQDSGSERFQLVSYQKAYWYWGNGPEAMRLTLIRDGLIHYRVSDLCYVQPAQSTARRCPSDNR